MRPWLGIVLELDTDFDHFGMKWAMLSLWIGYGNVIYKEQKFFLITTVVNFKVILLKLFPCK